MDRFLRISLKSGTYLFLFLVSSLLIFSCAGGNSDDEKQQNEVVGSEGRHPNVLIIYVDQLRRYSAGFWSDTGFIDKAVGVPDPVITPNIDFLAHNGVVFSNGIANYPLCSPSRGMMLSGMYPEQNGLWNNARKDRTVHLKEDVETITDVFYNAGYDIGYFGKAHYIRPEPVFDSLGNYVGKETAPGGYYINDYDTYVPPGKNRHSIDYFYQNVKDQHYDPLTYSNDPDLVDGRKDGEQYRPKDFTPKLESEAIIEYLKNQRAQRSNDKPFFAIWSINPPHSPWDEKNTMMEMLRKYYDTDKYPVVDSLLVRKNVDINVSKDYVRNYFANTTAVDFYIGKVIESLRAQNLLDNTIIVFSADHGEMMGSHGLQDKNVLYTEALAVPFIVYRGENISPGRKGVTKTLLGSPDILPTIANLAGISHYLPSSIEGNDLSSFITNPNREVGKDESLLLMIGNSRGLKTHQYTLVLKENKEPWDDWEGTELEEKYFFDDINDPYQLQKLPLDKNPKIKEKLLPILAKKLKETRDPWYQKKKYKEVIPYE